MKHEDFFHQNELAFKIRSARVSFMQKECESATR